MTQLILSICICCTILRNLQRLHFICSLLQELDRRGVADTSRIAVGGHSYGAFMAANLLAHAPELFACGIARSGAYNR